MGRGETARTVAVMLRRSRQSWVVKLPGAPSVAVNLQLGKGSGGFKWGLVGGLVRQ